MEKDVAEDVKDAEADAAATVKTTAAAEADADTAIDIDKERIAPTNSIGAIPLQPIHKIF